MTKKLPDRLIVLKNPDKDFHEKWTANRGKLNFPHPYRAVLAGPPNMGKTMVVKNILIRADPPFEKVIVCHNDADSTLEYDDIDCELRGDIPCTTDHDGSEKTLVILDDLEFAGLGKEDLKNLDRLVGYDSTHKNISVMITSQTFTRLPPICRRCTNLFILWKVDDSDQIKLLSRRTGVDIERAFKCVIDTRDSVWIDKTASSPYPIRLNGFTSLKSKDKN